MDRHGEEFAFCSSATGVVVESQDSLTALFEAYTSGGQEGLKQVLDELFPELTEEPVRIV